MLDRAFLEDFAYWYKEIVGALGIFGFPVMDVFSSLSLSFHDISCRRLREVDERSTGTKLYQARRISRQRARI